MAAFSFPKSKSKKKSIKKSIQKNTNQTTSAVMRTMLEIEPNIFFACSVQLASAALRH